MGVNVADGDGTVTGGDDPGEAGPLIRAFVEGDRGRLELKGLQKPVPAWEVRWQPVAVSAIPMPSLLTDVGRAISSQWKI